MKNRNPYRTFLSFLIMCCGMFFQVVASAVTQPNLYELSGKSSK